MENNVSDHPIEIEQDMIIGYFTSLINQFYKILPLRESREPTLQKYLSSLQREMLGCKSLIPQVGKDGFYLSLLSTLQYFIDNECEVAVIKSDVFKSIGTINKLIAKYSIMPPQKGGG